MDAQFWIKAWNDGRTAFNQQKYHDKLAEYFPGLNPQKGERVLVPLCGKSVDLLWLDGLGLHVHGIELHGQAAEAFFAENQLAPVKKTQDGSFTHYSHGNIIISCGDFFKFGENENYDFIYDRAALVALPFSMRQDYARVVGKALKPGGKYLLIVYQYDQSKLEGPPFSVDDKEIHDLYGDRFTIKLLESEYSAHEGPRLSALKSLRQSVYVLEKIR